jgi:hypothetical protein
MRSVRFCVVGLAWLAGASGAACSDTGPGTGDPRDASADSGRGVDARVSAEPDAAVPDAAVPDTSVPDASLSEAGATVHLPDASAKPPDEAPDAAEGGFDDAQTSPDAADAGNVEGDAAPDADTASDASLADAADAAPFPPDVPFATPRGPCEAAERVGRFIVEAQEYFGVVQGTVADGVVPSTVQELVLEDGACRVYMRRTLVCLPACVSGETCGEEGVCIPRPENISIGDVHISGLTQPTLMSPLLPGNRYFAPGADNPPYLDPSEIILSARGVGDLPAFQLFGLGSVPLTESPSWVLEEGVDLQIAWPAPLSEAGTSVLVELTIDQHGSSPLSLSCEFPDTGSAAIPSELVDQMIGAGVSGFPNGRITRRTADHLTLDVGCIELAVGSPLAASVAVAGFTPCNGPEDCPSNQQCNLDLELCE